MPKEKVKQLEVDTVTVTRTKTQVALYIALILFGFGGVTSMLAAVGGGTYHIAGCGGPVVVPTATNVTAEVVNPKAIEVSFDVVVPGNIQLPKSITVKRRNGDGTPEEQIIKQNFVKDPNVIAVAGENWNDCSIDGAFTCTVSSGNRTHHYTFQDKNVEPILADGYEYSIMVWNKNFTHSAVKLAKPNFPYSVEPTLGENTNVIDGSDQQVLGKFTFNVASANGPTLDNFDSFGGAVTNIGDLDGDGVQDFAVGAPLDDEGGVSRGNVHILFMNPDGSVNSTREINDTTPNGPIINDNDRFGRSISSIGDLNGDGVQDLAVGAYLDDQGGPDRGAIHILFMNTDGTVDNTVEINSLTPNGPTIDDFDSFGMSITNIGDLNGDGVQDLAAGAYRDDGGGSNRGAVHIMFMNTNGSVSTTTEISETTPNGPILNNGDSFGISVENIGDLDGDGFNDIAVGAYGDDMGGYNHGAAHILFMYTDGSVVNSVELNSLTPNGPTLFNGDLFGRSITNIGDLDGDGVQDLAIGAPRDDGGGFNRGSVHVLFMNTDGSIKATIEINDSVINGPTLDDEDTFGVSLSKIGDFDGDGVMDLVVGAPRDDGSGTDSGALHIMFMNTDGSVDRTVEIGSTSTVSINTIGWTFSVNSNSADISDITNVTIYDPLDNIVAGPLDPVSTSGNFGTATSTDIFSVPSGTSTFTVKADLSTDFDNDDTITTHLYPHAIETNALYYRFEPSYIKNPPVTIKAPRLDVSVSGNPPAQTAIAGTEDFHTTDIILDASESADDIRITEIALSSKHTGLSFPNNLSGWKLFLDGDQIPINSESIDCGGASCNTPGRSATTTLTIGLGELTIDKGTSKTLKVEADVGAGAINGSFRVGCNGCVTVAIDSNANSVNAKHTNSDGQVMTLSEGGTLNVSLLSDPVSALVAGGSTVEVGRFTMEAKNEGITIDNFGLQITLPDGGIVGNQDEIETLTIEEVGGGSWSIPVSTNRATITPQNLNIGQNEEKTFVVNAKFNDISDASPAESGAGISVTLSNIETSGQTSGVPVNVNGLGNSFNTFSVLRSIPIIQKINFSGSDLITANNQEVELFKYSVRADLAGPVGLFKFTFDTTTTTVTLSRSRASFSGFKLYESDSSSTNGDNIAQSADMITTPSQNSLLIETYLDVNDNNFNAPAYEHRVLSAGSTKYYTLTGTIESGHDGTPDNESIATRLIGDAAFAGTSQLNAFEIDITAEDDFIWSDLHLDLYATFTATSSKMFYNGYRVPGLGNASSSPQVITD